MAVLNNERIELLSAAAEQLFAVRKNACAIDELPKAIRPADINESYKLQEILNKKLLSSLGDPVGYKIGCTTRVMQEYLQISHPCAGRIFESTVQSGSGVYSARELCRPGVECEIAVLIEHDMPDGQTYTARGVAEFTNTVMASIELVDDRWTDYQSVAVHSLIADNFFGAGCVLGQPASPGFEEVASATGTLRINGVVTGSGSGVDILGHPYEALAWLANHQVGRGTPLRAGDYVSLGSVVKTHWLEVGDVVEIEFAGLGGCSLTLQD